MPSSLNYRLSRLPMMRNILTLFPNLQVVCFAAFGSLFTGYSLAVFAFTIGQPTFYTSIGLVADTTAPGYSHTSDILGAANGVFFGTGFLGSYLAGWAGNRFGRINGFRIAAVTGAIGGALQTGSQSTAMVCLLGRHKT
jgi:MFS family permease